MACQMKTGVMALFFAFSFFGILQAFAGGLQSMQATIALAPDQKVFAKPGQVIQFNVSGGNGGTITRFVFRVRTSDPTVTNIDPLAGGDSLATIDAPASILSGHAISVSSTISNAKEASSTLNVVDGTQVVDGPIGFMQLNASQIPSTFTQIAVTSTNTNGSSYFRNGTTNILVNNVPGLVTVLHCNTPFADADGDGDVDQMDFGMLQVCFTDHLLPADYQTCGCFDRPMTGKPSGDNKIDSYDFAAFAACQSGPSVPADPDCENTVIPEQ